MKVLGGIVLGVLLVLAAEYLFLTQGGVSMASHGAHPLPLEKLLASRALHAAIGKYADRPPPIRADEPNLLAGANVYRHTCATCHGAPGETERTAIARGMFPTPPRLLPPAKGVTDDPPGETYWKVKNGIRLTGMPGFEGALTDTQLWQVSLLVAHADHLPPAVDALLRTP